MSLIQSLRTGVLCLALIATGCGTDGRDIEVQSTSTEAPGSVATLAPGTVHDVVIRVRVDGGGEGRVEVPQRATLQLPPNADGSLPVVVLLHGAHADKQSMSAMADAIADTGIPVLNASWLLDMADPAKIGGDAVCAVAYAYQNASLWGADPHRVIVMGHSGGGSLGMLAGLAPESFPDCETASDSHVWAYIGIAGDPAAAAPGGNLRRFLIHDAELLALMDNYTHIGGNPDLIARFVHGTADLTVPIELTSAFHDALIAAGYDSAFFPVSGADHFDPAKPTTDAGHTALDQLASLVELTHP